MQCLGVVLVLLAIGVNMSNLPDSYGLLGIIVGLVGGAILLKERNKRDKM